MKQKVKYKGIMFIVLSALCFAFMNVFVRMAGDLVAQITGGAAQVI